MNYRERMKEYLKEPDERSSQWGRWGILNKEQRDLIKRLLREMDSADVVIKNQFEENEKLKELCNKYEEEHKTVFEEWKKTINIINELEKWLESESNFWKEQQEKAIENGWLEFGGKYNTTIIYENAINKLQELKGEDKE